MSDTLKFNSLQKFYVNKEKKEQEINPKNKNLKTKTVLIIT